MKHKIKLLVVAGLLLAVSSALGAPQFLSLKNSKGEIVYQEKSNKEIHPRKSSEDELKQLKIVNYVWDHEIKSGEAAVIYVTKNNPEQQLHIRANNETLTKIDEVRNKLKSSGVSVPSKLPGNFKFSHAEILMSNTAYDKPYTDKEKIELAQKLQKQAAAAKKEYAVMPIKTTDRLMNARMFYKLGKKELVLDVYNAGKGIVTSYVEENNAVSKTVISINMAEVLVTSDKEAGTADLTWVVEQPKTGEKLQYKLSSWSNVKDAKDRVSDKELKSIAKELIKK